MTSREMKPASKKAQMLIDRLTLTTALRFPEKELEAEEKAKADFRCHEAEHALLQYIAKLENKLTQADGG